MPPSRRIKNDLGYHSELVGQYQKLYKNYMDVLLGDVYGITKTRTGLTIAIGLDTIYSTELDTDAKYNIRNRNK